MNATFIALIPKSSAPSSFNDFRPVSLCNVIYKINAKIIANRLKSVLVEGVTKNQFGFFPGQQILDVIGTSQECLHSMKVNNIKGLMLKLDLKKAYDKVNWIFLRLILLQMGFSLQLVNWIMVGVSSANFAVLINEMASGFFKSQRGMRQRCPLSPFYY